MSAAGRGAGRTEGQTAGERGLGCALDHQISEANSSSFWVVKRIMNLGPIRRAGSANRQSHRGSSRTVGRVFEMPRLTILLRHALPRFVEGVLAPVAVFYAALVVLGLHGALIAAVGLVYLGVLLRVVRRRPVPGTLLLAAIGVTARAVVSAATGSVVIYFLQPTFGTLLVAMTFLASVPLGKPLAQKLAVDMVPLPDAFLEHERVRQFFLRISLLWSLVLLANVAITLWLLLSQSIGVFLWVRTSVVAALGAAAIGVSIISFRRLLRRVNAERSHAPRALPHAPQPAVHS